MNKSDSIQLPENGEQPSASMRLYLRDASRYWESYRLAYNLIHGSYGLLARTDMASFPSGFQSAVTFTPFRPGSVGQSLLLCRIYHRCSHAILFFSSRVAVPAMGAVAHGNTFRRCSGELLDCG